MVTINQLNEGNQLEFVSVLKDIFEHSPWIPERAWSYRPFTSLEDLHEKMVQIVQEATYEEKLCLIQEHPNLGVRLEMSISSVKEQANAGLNQLSAEEYKKFSLLNKQYMNKFGFPFIMAVKGQTKEVIYSSMERRVAHPPADEFETALIEIEKIALFRLRERLPSK